MARFYRVKKGNSIKKYIVILFVFEYLLFCTVALMVSPTTAYFTDNQTVNGVISASTQFEEEEITDKAGKLSDDTASSDHNNGKENISSTSEKEQDEPKSKTTDRRKKNKESPSAVNDPKSNEAGSEANSLPTQNTPNQKQEISNKKTKVAPDTNEDTDATDELSGKE